MRLVADIPHERFKIQIHNYNSKYIVKIELAQFEQTFKISETDVNGLEDVKKMITESLLKNSLERFVSMRADWAESFKSINTL
jgi:fibronectin type 3 domain-containing protein